MKKTYLILMALCLLLASCGKDSEIQWSRFYGFTAENINGHYNANPDESVYETLPTAGVVVYKNVSIDISASNSAVTMHIVIPNTLDRSFSGSIDLNDDYHSDLVLYNNSNEDVMLTVYKDKNRTVRLQGRVKHSYYNSNGLLYQSKTYEFDVIKAAEK